MSSVPCHPANSYQMYCHTVGKATNGHVVAHHVDPTVPAPNVWRCRAVKAITEVDSIEIARLKSCDASMGYGHYFVEEGAEESKSASVETRDP